MRPLSRPDSPLAPLAAALVVGSVLALADLRLPIPLLAGLAALGLALGHRWSRWLAWVALAALSCQARGLPAAATPSSLAGRPVSALVAVSGHVRCDVDACSVWVWVERLRQGDRLQATAFDARLVVRDSSAGSQLGVGRRLEVRGFLDRPQAHGNGQVPRPGSWRLRVPSLRLVALRGRGGPVDSFRNAIHRRARSLWESTGAAPSLASALVMGDTSRLGTSAIQGLRRIGLGHVLAVSGLHVGLVVVGTLALGFGLPRWLRLLAAGAAALGLLALAGPRPSVARATLMALSAIAALSVARPPQARNALAAAVIVMVLVEPAIVNQLGFRLSVAATLGLLELTPRMAAALSQLPRWLRIPVAASLAAQLATAPFARPVFAWCAPLSLVANLVAIPYLGLVLGVLMLSTAVGLVTGSLPLPQALLDGLAYPWVAAGALPSGPWTGWPTAWSPVGAALASTTLVLVLLAGGRQSRKLAVGAYLLVLPHAAPVAEPTLQMLDVGQGDAILIRDGRHAVLVDGGGWPRGDLAGRVLVPALAAAGVRRLDGVILSHGDRDHCGGLVDLTGYLEVPVLWASADALATPCGAALARRSRRFEALGAGWTLAVGRWHLEAVAAGGEGLTANDASVVLRAAVRGRSALLTGDIESRGERRLVRRNASVLAADILKVAHHGSRSSSTAELLLAVAPRIALVSAGQRNPYGHPSPAVLRRLSAAGALVLRTDRDGSIRLLVRPGGRLEVSTQGR